MSVLQPWQTAEKQGEVRVSEAQAAVLKELEEWKDRCSRHVRLFHALSLYAVRLRLSHKNNVTYCDQGVHFQPSLDYSKHTVNAIFFKAVSNVTASTCAMPQCVSRRFRQY